MAPNELRDLASAHVSKTVDKKTGEEQIIISSEKLTLSPAHAAQFNELCGKLIEKELLKSEPEVERLSRAGALLVPAETLVEVLDLAGKNGIGLEDPQ